MLLDKLRSDLKNFMKTKQVVKKETVQLLMNSVINTTKEKKSSLTEQEEFAIVQKELKQNKESLEAFKKGNREDLVMKSEEAIELLYSYLPKQLTPAEIEVMVKENINELNIDINNKGLTMKSLMPLFKGIADGRVVSQIINKITSK